MPKRGELVPLSTEELAVARPKSALGKLVAVATVALVTGCVLFAMSAKEATKATPGAAVAAAAPNPTTPAPGHTASAAAASTPLAMRASIIPPPPPPIAPATPNDADTERSDTDGSDEP